MRFSDGVEWSIHCAAVLAGLPPNAALAAKDLAEFHGVSASYLVKHLKLLVQAQLLESVPGPAGGYRLSRPAKEITLLDLLEAVEGPFRPFRCTEIRRRGPVADGDEGYSGLCQINAAMKLAERAYREELAKITLESLVLEVAATIPPARRSRAAHWVELRVRPSHKGE